MNLLNSAVSKHIGEYETLKQIVLFCLAGLFVTVLILTYGVDLSPAFF